MFTVCFVQIEYTHKKDVLLDLIAKLIRGTYLQNNFWSYGSFTADNLYFCYFSGGKIVILD